MSCQHVWERRDKQTWCLPYYICTECEMELSTDQYEALQQAHRAGFEEGKKQTAQECYKMVCSDEYVFGARNLAKAIKSKFGLEG